MPRLIAGLLLLATCSHALVTLLPAVARSSRAGTVEMKHPDYFQRIARSEAGRPRLCVFRSNNHIYGQVIDDSKDAVLVAASTTEAEMREGNTANQEAATAVGKLLAARALAKGIDKVYFDRNGKKYHGRIMALADGAREGGLSF
eukprot:jgi/Chrpa1/23590/Chrysochromulina_OHIO_Genome00008743-RA